MRSLLLQVQNRTLKRRDANLENLNNGLKLYYEIARQFVSKAVQKVIFSIVNEPNMDMDITEVNHMNVNSKVS